jgi:hypothetical protein
VWDATLRGGAVIYLGSGVVTWLSSSRLFVSTARAVFLDGDFLDGALRGFLAGFSSSFLLLSLSPFSSAAAAASASFCALDLRPRFFPEAGVVGVVTVVKEVSAREGWVSS